MMSRFTDVFHWNSKAGAVTSAWEVTFPLDVPNRRANINSRSALALSSSSITFARDAARACAEIAGGVAPSNSGSPFGDTFSLSDDATPSSGLWTTKAAAGLLSMSSVSTSGTASASEARCLHGKHAAESTASLSAAMVRGRGSLKEMANATYPPPALHSLGGALVCGAVHDLQRTGESNIMPASESAWPTVGHSKPIGRGNAGRRVAETQYLSRDVCSAPHSAPCSIINSPIESSATDFPKSSCPALEVLVTGPPLLVEREPVHIHWCCAAHWRAVQRTERGAQWTVGGVPADVYCVPARPHVKRGCLGHLISDLRTSSEADRQDGTISHPSENTRWINEAPHEVKPQHLEGQPPPSLIAPPAPGIHTAGDNAVVSEKCSLPQAPSRSPHVHRRARVSMPSCEFCGRVVGAYYSKDSGDESVEPRTPTDEKGEGVLQATSAVQRHSRDLCLNSVGLQGE